MTDTQSERGQLILAGAVSFALILIAIALVFSTTLFTASVGSSGTVETVADGTGVEQSVENTTAELIRDVNETDVSDHEDELRENVTTYSELLANSTAASGPTYLNVSVVDTGAVNPDADIDWAKVRIVYETADVERETTINVSAS